MHTRTGDEVEPGHMTDQLPPHQGSLDDHVLIVWAATEDEAQAAETAARDYARLFRYRVTAAVRTRGPRMREARLYPYAERHFVRRDIRYGSAWWLVPAKVISPRDLAPLGEALAPVRPTEPLAP